MKNTTEPERFSRTDDPAVPDLTIIAPVYKNASTLDELAARITSTSEQAGYTFEILFVDDACPQGSLDVLKRLASRDDRVSVISLAQNTGQAQAVMTGLDHLRSRFFVIMDADLQDPPEAIPELVRGLEEGYDVVFAGRAGHYESSGRLATSRLYKWTIHILTGLPADAGLFLAARRIVAEKLLAAHQSGILIVPMIGTFKLRTFSIPVERALRPVGESAYTG
ncbi:MAG TPA: glycosyltransferase family 2 protein, partial [Anaerolineales bacterium]|nr:glycosyltransferase family 2 protein [Anaerolineales bacterium]